MLAVFNQNVGQIIKGILENGKIPAILIQIVIGKV